jgi:hypothetical protein
MKDKSIAAPRASLPYPFKVEKMPAAVHWSPSLKPGEYKIINGVIHEREPAGKRPLMVAGISAQPPQKLLQDLLNIQRLNLPQRAQAHDEIANWAARYYGRDLPYTKQMQWRQLYRQFVQEKNKIAAVKTTDRKGQRRLIEIHAKLIADLLSGEREIFLNNPKAQLIRYGKVVVKPTSKKPDRNIIERDLIRFLSGEYIKNEKDQVMKKTTGYTTKVSVQKKQYVMMPSSRQGYFYVKDKLSMQPKTTPVVVGAMTIPLVVEGKCRRRGSMTSTQLVEGPVGIGMEGRIFVTDHPVTGSTWEDMGYPELYHTSIIAGSWIVKKTVEEVTTRTCQVIGAMPTVIKKKQDVYMKEFYTWNLANGCSGTYKHDDEIREITRVYYYGADSFSRLQKYFFGTTPDHDGSRCRARYGAYPMGAYGTDWVCHQSCNAFAAVKWNMLPVFYIYAAILFDEVGGQGLADIDAPCQCIDTSANHCCIPGNYCCWGHTWGQGDGWGYALSSGWHPKKGWIDTECKFTTHIINIDGWDKGPFIHPLN